MQPNTDTNTNTETRWPLTLPAPARGHLANVQAARADASAEWKKRHPGSRQEIPHRDFLAMIGLKMDATVFSKLISEQGYPANTAEGLLAQLDTAVTRWKMARAYAQRVPVRPIHAMPWYAEMEDAARASSHMEESHVQERAVVLLAPTGCGKTTLARWLRDRLGLCHIVSAHESWRGSYFAVLSSVLRALGQRVPHGQQKAEAALLEYLTENKVTLIFDEQDYFGRSALNLIRQILNETRAAVVMHMVPETWDRIVRDGGEYARQFCRRCCVVKPAPKLTDADALLFLRESLPEAPEKDLRGAAKILVREANIFGSVSLLDAVSNMLAHVTLEPGETYTEKADQGARLYHTRHQLSLNISAA